MLTKNVGLCCNSTHIFLYKFNILIEGKEKPAKTKLLSAKLRAVTHHFGSAENFNGRLRAVWHHFGFSKYFRNIFEISLKDPKSTGNWSFRKSNQTVWLCAVCHHFGFSHISISRLRAVAHCVESRFSRISSRKRIFQRNYFRLFIRDPDGFDSWKKKIANNLVTLPL